MIWVDVFFLFQGAFFQVQDVDLFGEYIFQRLFSVGVYLSVFISQIVSSPQVGVKNTT